MDGRIVKKLRKDKKMSQDDLAKKLGVARSTIAMYENGDRDASANVLVKLAEVLEVSVEYLMGTTDEQKRFNARIQEDIFIKFYNEHEHEIDEDDKEALMQFINVYLSSKNKYKFKKRK